MKRLAITTSAVALLGLAACAPSSNMQHAVHDSCDAVVSNVAKTLVTSAVAKSVVLHKHPKNCNILFDFASHKIRPIYYTPLDFLARSMADGNIGEVTLIGHTDSVGSNAANDALSRRRVNQIKHYLADHQGVDGSKIHTAYEGEVSPVDTNSTDSGRQENRRVEIRFNYK